MGGWVLPLKGSFDEVVHRLLVDVLLRAVALVDVVVGVGLVGAQPGLRLARGLGDADLAGVDDLTRQLRTDPHGHADAGGGAVILVPHPQSQSRILDTRRRAQSERSNASAGPRYFLIFIIMGEILPKQEVGTKR